MADQLTRGALPHWYRPGYAHFVTYRLAGSIPQVVLRELRRERDERLRAPAPKGTNPVLHREQVNKIMFAKYDHVLDSSSTVNWLANDAIALIVQENLYHHHDSKYELLAYCIMPNHVHVVLQPFESALAVDGVVGPVGDAASVAWSDGDINEPADTGSVAYDTFETPDGRSVLSSIMHSLKSYTANRANEALKRSGQFWQTESYDHWVRDLDELDRIVSYVALNPVRAGLCDESHLWRFSSAYDRFQKDGSRSALVGWLRDDWRR